MVEPLFARYRSSGRRCQHRPRLCSGADGSAHRPSARCRPVCPQGLRTCQCSACLASNPMPVGPRVPGGVVPALGPSVGAGLSAIGSGPLATNVPAMTTSEIAGGVTSSVLLTAVAMRRGQPLGPTNDQEIEDFMSDALDLLPGTNDVEVRVEGGRATLTGSVPHKRLKRDVGEIAWTIPTLNDVHNNVTVTQRRRSRTSREGESPVVAGRKQT